MLQYIFRRLLALIPVIIIVSFVTAILVRLTPGDPVLIMTGGRKVSQETLTALREKYALDKDPITQYMLWAGKAVRGDLGESFRLKQSVGGLVVQRLPITLKLMAFASVLALLISIPLGVLSARYKNSVVDQVSSILTLVGSSTPVFFLGIVGILIFSYWLKWLPAFGAGKDSVADELLHLILPGSVLALSMLAPIARMTRAAMIDVLGSDYIRTARAKGLHDRGVTLTHALRNALIPVVTVASLQVAFLLVGSVLVEYTFGLGGIGSLITDGIQNRDYPIVQGVTLLLVLFFLVINLLTDLLYGVLDPRIRYA